MKRIQGLDLMRFFAVMMIVALHAAESVNHPNAFLHQLFKTGWVGVDCFFVLSGYLIGGQVFRTNDLEGSRFYHIKTFWMRRWWRTLPLYFTALFFYVVIKPALGFPFKDFNFNFFIFLQNYSRIFDFVQSWSLCIEEHFYLFFPLVAFIFKLHRKNPLVWLGFVAFSVAARAYVWSQGGLEPTAPGIDFGIRFVSHYHLDGIAMGIFLAGTKNHWQNYSVAIRRPLAVIGLFLAIYFPFITPYYLPGTSVVWMFSLVSLGFSLMLIGIHDLGIPQILFRPIHKVALWSYGIYIWNSVVIRIFHHLSLDLNPSIEMLLFFIVSVCAGIPTYYLIEKPFLAIRDRRLQKMALAIKKA